MDPSAPLYGQQLLYRAFQWIHLPHYMTRPPSDKGAIDITDEACARRLLARSEELRSMRTLYPQLTADPALLTDFLQESVDAHILYGPPLASDTYGLQLAKAAGCLVAELQRSAGEEINVDRNMSQSDLLFVLYAGGVYQPDATANQFISTRVSSSRLARN